MNQLRTINESSNQLTTISALNADLYFNFISFLDVKEKTADTYRKALKRLFQYFAENYISQPTRSDLIAFRDELKAVNTASTVNTYLTATRLFYPWLEQ